ncbi:type VI secretion system secreted protein VgrG [Pseudacidovorax intermedius]|uniref:Type VI secretion system secreted protein VgrG n=1 Tax=Pseudacidovorax intermedius TaxID=433924 RepID=A0A370FBG6_9BURK|nr:type VI secretion system Vgr family protein [Pseudacidovorax intermedius]RDI21956.1 type VI secretion system secreted protein VgrG [Pseudacidovorax intermedius]
MSTLSHTLRVSSPVLPVYAGKPLLHPVRLAGREGVNVLFDYELILQTPEGLSSAVTAEVGANLDLDSFVGREIHCEIELDGAGYFAPGAVGPAVDHIGAGTRQINALITEAELLGEEGRHLQYRLRLQPWLHLATLNSDCRIFQNATAVDILDAVLADYPFPVVKRLIEPLPKRDYQTQFNESDFAFFERLCQEWGINYHFEHEQGAHRLVLSDHLGAFGPTPSAAYRSVEYHPPGWKVDAEYLHAFVPASRVTSGRYTSRDYDYTRPKAKLDVSRRDPRPTGQADAEVYAWHASLGGSHYAQPSAGVGPNDPRAEGELIARLRMQQLRTAGARARASGNLRGMVPGFTFALSRHPRKAANTEYLILQTELLIEDLGQDSQRANAAADRQRRWRVNVDLTAHPVTEQLRPDLTRLKPHTHGPQTARVVGPEGQELWTDELGRIKVQFPWDRQGRENQHSSCWVRVSSPWAGNQLGGVHIPRIGQEVIVEFLGGDPDLPICTARVHNQLNLPPWSLPGQSALSGFRSRELTQAGGNSAAGRSNHLVMDDTAGSIQAQLKSDHQHSSLSLGRITRIEDNQGRKDPRGEGLELRTDGPAAVRAGGGMLITTEARTKAQGHIKDMGETTERLSQARDLHQSAADIAQKNKGQQAGDQEEVANALRAHNDAIRGSGQGKPAAGEFPELEAPHLLLASPAGIHATSQHGTHLASAEHTAITSGKHTSVVSGDSLLAVALQAIKLLAAQKGIQVVAAQADIEIQALMACIHMAAKDEITLKADKINIEAKTQLNILGGGSYTQFKSGLIDSGTSGADVRHAASHSMVGPSQQGSSSLPEGNKPGKGQLELTHQYASGRGLESATYAVVDVLGQVRSGTLDGSGFAAVAGLAPGGTRVSFGKDPSDPWSLGSYFGKPEWPAQAHTGASPMAEATVTNDLVAGLLQRAATGAGAQSSAGARLTASSSPAAAPTSAAGKFIGSAPSNTAVAQAGALATAVFGSEATAPAMGALAAVGSRAAGMAQLPPGVSLARAAL